MSPIAADDPAPEASLDHLAAVFQSAIDAIIAIDGLGLITSVNPAAARLFGYTNAELIGANVSMLMPAPDSERHDDYLRQYRHTGRRKIIGIGREVFGRRRDGSTFPMHLSVSEYQIDGKAHFAGIVRDLTMERRVQEESERQQVLFEAIIKDTPRALVLTDSGRRIFLANPAVKSVFGYDEAELVGQSSRLLYETDYDFERVWRASLAGSTGLDPLAVNCRRKDGKVFPAEVVATSVTARNGQILGHMRSFRDLTKQVAQTEALHRSQRLDALGQLTGGVAHDFNNILTIVLGNLEQVFETSDVAEKHDFCRRALEAGEMGARLTRRLLSFSRQRKLEPAVLQLNTYITSMVEMLERALGETVSLSTNFAQDLWMVCVDPSEIENAILNLSVNARDAMRRGGRVSIETANLQLTSDDVLEEYGIPAGDYIRITVADNGEGMSPEIVKRAFEPFFTTKGTGKGTGLGLSSIHGFVKQSGGNVTIYSELGKGTVVNLYLPRVAMDVPRDLQATEKHAIPPANLKVLIVEDNPELRQLVAERIRRLGYTVEEADSGACALQKLSEESFDILFSDVVMPGGMSGYELGSLARVASSGTKILLTSGYDSEFASELNSTNDTFHVLRKPYRQADLAQALRDCL
ncbi:PAS domain S-box protein [Hyphomicrobium sp. B1]|uniref:PAS domain-containing hybrid sensor histidine kinase/response regulator n=1 Tax=Hyphomicrobium sp. B1 TaxID=3075651 RepID=UPI003C30C78F